MGSLASWTRPSKPSAETSVLTHLMITTPGKEGIGGHADAPRDKYGPRLPRTVNPCMMRGAGMASSDHPERSVVA